MNILVKLIFKFCAGFIALSLVLYSCAGPRVSKHNPRSPSSLVIMGPHATCDYLAQEMKTKRPTMWSKSLAVRCQGELPMERDDQHIPFELCGFLDDRTDALSFGGLSERGEEIADLFPVEFLFLTSWMEKQTAKSAKFTAMLPWQNCEADGLCLDASREHSVHLTYNKQTNTAHLRAFTWQNGSIESVDAKVTCQTLIPKIWTRQEGPLPIEEP